MMRAIELVFEDLNDEQADNLVCLLVKRQDICRLVHGELGELSLTRASESVVSMVREASSPAAIFVHALKLRIEDIVISRPFLRIYDLGPEIEVTIVFDSNDVIVSADENASLQLARASASVAKRVGAKDYYCGIEPASDTETRFFTAESIGPLPSF